MKIHEFGVLTGNFIISNILDAISTNLALQHEAVEAVELNPIMNWSIENFSLESAMIVKIIIAFIGGLMFWWGWKISNDYNRKIVFAGLIILNIMYISVVSSKKKNI